MMDRRIDIEHGSGAGFGRPRLHHWIERIEGWADLIRRSSAALTPFARHRAEPPAREPAHFMPHWALLPAELQETPDEVVLRIELAGVDKADCHVTIDGSRLRVRGERAFMPLSDKSVYHLEECAYGAFERLFELPPDADTDRAQASLQNGVLCVRMPKLERPRGHPVEVE